MATTKDQLRDKFSERNQELERQLREKDRLLEQYKKEHGQMEVFFDRVVDAISPIVPLPNKYEQDGKTKVDSPCSAVMQITDTHYGAVQTPSEIENFNSFSPQVCIDRSMLFCEKLLKWTKVHRYAYKIPTLHILLTGDLISGDIRRELSVTNAFPVPVQCVESGRLIGRQIATVAPHFKRVVVHFLVADNHSRRERKPQAKQEGYNSDNYVVGRIIELYLKKHENVEFNIYPQYEKVIRIENMQYLITHGHNLRGWMGIPWYSYQRHVGKEAIARMSQILTSESLPDAARRIGFHKMITGHFHTPFDHPLYSCGGSLSGTDAYDHKDGRYAEPSQAAWLVHPRHGEFDRTNFILK